ncbi:MAG TPA: hypothetical protein VLM18_03395 [Croceibacterium sp.]|nr:hypothetical protein [Croceibacterium sp.]
MVDLQIMPPNTQPESFILFGPAGSMREKKRRFISGTKTWPSQVLAAFFR